MNHIYRTIWSKASNSFVAVSENTKSGGKVSSSQKSATIAVAAALLALSGNVAFAAGGIVNGNTTIDGAGGIIDGGAAGGYFVQSGIVSISNATLSNFSTVGGLGSGGGAGLGGALFINTGGVVTLNNVNFLSNTVTGGDANASATVGGSLNGLFNAGSTGSTGANGRDAPSQSYTVTDGTGWIGYNGENGGDGSILSAGGTGGKGGNGSNGDAPEATAAYLKEIADKVYDTATMVKDTLDGSTFYTGLATQFKLAATAAGAQVAGPVPVVSTLPGFFTAIAAAFDAEAALPQTTITAAESVKLAADITYMTAMRAAVAEYGVSGSGGDGGSGGNGGNGSAYLGGGAGGNGGNGGNAYDISKAIAGAGGDGGKGGMGGFGAGGGRGGDGGTAGTNGNGVAHAAVDGAGGDGGKSGFGGGTGSAGNTPGEYVAGGNGGSGYGGAIFVRDGGTLVVTGNATFDGNDAVGGNGQLGTATILDGEAGSGAGTDLFMMKGSNVILSPGQGNVITFNGSIADDSAASITSPIVTGKGAGLTVQDGLVIFNGDNTYTGQTKIADGGVLQAMDGNADHPTLHTNSNINLAGGIFQSNGLFNRYLGTASNRVQWTASGGFAAVEGDLTVRLNNNAKLTWGQPSFVGNGNALLFGSNSATDAVTFTNAINLNGGNRTVLVTANEDNSDTATLSGILSNGALTVGDETHTGVAMLAGANTYAGGTTVNGGTLALTGTGSLLSSGLVTVNTAGTFDISKTGNQTIGNLDGSGKVMLGASTLTLSQNNDSTFSGSIQDGGLLATAVGGGLLKQGTGTFTLSGANTYTGTTQINSGILNLTGSLKSGVINVASGATLNDTKAGLAANSALTNAGTVNLGANNTIAAFTNTGTLNGAGQTLTAATYNLNNGSVINANLGTGVMTNNGVVALNGTSGAATVNIASGTTTLGSAQRLLNIANVTVAGNLLLGGTQQIGQLFGAGNVDLTKGTFTVNSGAFSGVLKSSNANFGLTKISNGTLALSGANTYTGATQINAGTLDLTGSLASGTVNVAGGATLNNTNGGLATNAALTNAGTVNLGANNTIATLANTGTINGTGQTLTAATYNLNNGSVVNANLGTGVMTNNGAVALNGTSNAATVNIASGTTTLGSAQRLLNTANVAVAGNLLLGGTQQIGQLFGAGNVDLTNGTLIVDSGAFSGILQSNNANFGLTKISNGTLALSGANTYTGATQINAGILDLTGSLASGAVSVASGATLNNTNGGLAANAALTNAGTVNLGVNNAIAAFTSTGTLNGAGQTLTAATYNLNNGAVINANLGTGVMTNNGAVALNGTSDAATVNIASGTTTLGSAQRLLNVANVTVAGNLLLGGNQQIGQLFGAGNVDLTNGTLTVDSGAFSGVLQSNNANFGLTKISNETQALSGANTYTGATLVNAGVLDLTGSLASAAVSVASGAILNDTNAGLAANATLNNDGIVNLGANNTIAALINSGTINGVGQTLTAATYALNNGSVINANLGTGIMTTSGMVTLNGTSAADVINVLAGSILNLGDPLNLGSSGSHLTNPAVTTLVNGILNINGGDESVGALFGVGTINLMVNQFSVGNGGLFSGTINGGANTNFNVNGGTLALANATLATLSTSISNGGVLALTNSNYTTQSTDISNTALLSLTNSNYTTQSTNVSGGAISLTNTNFTTQTTDVSNGGSVVLNNNSVLNSPAITVGNNSVISLDGSSSLNYTVLGGGNISTPGGVINAANFTNSIGSTVNGFLTFTGNFVNSGTLAPGNSPGLTTIAKDFTSNGTYQAQIQTTTPVVGHDQIRVGGTVTLNPNSTLIAQPWAGAVPVSGNVYQIIANSTGAPIRASGAFGNVLFDNGSATGPVSNAAVVFDVNTGKLIATGLNAANSQYADMGTNLNQRVAASALMSAAMSGVGPNQIDSSTGAGNAASALLTSQGAINHLVPESYSSITDYSLLANKVVSNILFSRPFSSSKSSKTDSNSNFITDKSAYVGYTHNQYAASGNNVYRNDFYLGAEAGNDKLSLGLLFLGSTGTLRSTYSNGNVDSIGGTAYLKAAVTPALKVLGSVGYTGYNYTLNRPSVVGSASGKTTSDGINAGLGLTYLTFDKNGYSIQPRIALGYGNASVKGFQEGGSAQSLSLSGQTASRLSGQLGVIFAKDFEVADRPLKVALDLGVDTFFTDKKGDINATMVADSRVKFPIGFSSNAKTFGSAGISANYEITKFASIYAKYEANTMGNTINNNATIELKSSF